MAGGAAHPRVSGENFDLYTDEYVDQGSSPRERGKRPATVWAVGLSRLIPA